MIAPSPTAVYARYSDPEGLVQGIRGANLEPRQLSRGTAPSELARVQFPRACLDLARLGTGMLFSGAMARDCYTILFVLDCPVPGRAFNFGVEHTDGFISLWKPGETIDTFSPSGFCSATFTIPVDDFAAGMSIFFPDAPDALMRSGGVARVSPAAQAPLRQIAQTAWEISRHPDQPLNSSGLLRQANSNTQAAFFKALGDGWADVAPPAPPRAVGRHRRLRLARDYLAAHIHEPVYLAELCAALGLTSRTVENLFQEFLGIGPTAYLRNQRLHGARRALLQTSAYPGAVKRIALEWGFRHHGHFARDYYALFGEHPVSTLRR